jgi:hypothetical protein
MTTFTVHNQSEVTEFIKLVHLGAGPVIEWATPHGEAIATLACDPLQSWVYKVGQHKVPAEQLIKQLVDAGIDYKYEPMAPGMCQCV